MRGKKVILPILATIFACTVGLESGNSAIAETLSPSSEVKNEFIEETLSTYEGIYMQVKSAPSDNYRKIGIVKEEPLTLDSYLSVRFRNLADANVPFRITIEDSKGNKWATSYTGSKDNYQEHWYVPEGTKELQTAKEYNGCMYLTKEYRGGEVLIDLSTLSKVQGEPLTDIKKIFFGLPAAYNLAEKLELLSLSTVTTVDDQPITADTNVDSLQRDTFYDFTTIQTEADIQALFANRTFLKCNSDDAITSTFNSYMSVGKTEKVRGVSLGHSSMDGVKFAMKANSTLTENDETSEQYCADKFGYIRLADFSDAPITPSDALAIKMSALYNKSAFRLILVDADGEAYRAGTSAGEYPFVTEGKAIEYMPTYYNCLWPEKKSGTLVLDYTAFSFQNEGALDIANNGAGNKKLDKIAEIYLSMDMAATSKEAVNRKIAVSSIADVDYDTQQISVLADLTSYTTTEKSNGVADINYANPMNAKITKPMAKSSFKNGNWVLGKVAISELAEKAPIDEKHIGDVKVLDNFSIVDKNYTQEEKNAIIADFYTTYGEKSYLSTAEGLNGQTALCWTVGNYVSEYENVSGGYCGLTVNPVSVADNWGDWTNAKGMTLWVKNPQSREISFNIGFQQTIDGQTVSYRMDFPNSVVYALDTKTGEEFSFPTAKTIYLPPNFEGWIRIDFSEFGKYSSYGPDAIDFSKSVIALKLTSYMLDNSDMSLIFGCVGVYYDNFGVKLPFGNAKTIAECLAGGGNNG